MFPQEEWSKLWKGRINFKKSWLHIKFKDFSRTLLNFDQIQGLSRPMNQFFSRIFKVFQGCGSPVDFKGQLDTQTWQSKFQFPVKCSKPAFQVKIYLFRRQQNMSQWFQSQILTQSIFFQKAEEGLATCPSEGHSIQATPFKLRDCLDQLYLFATIRKNTICQMNSEFARNSSSHLHQVAHSRARSHRICTCPSQ